MEDVFFNYRIHHLKLRPFHLISQLDITRLWDRVLRRSMVPVAYTRGFNPRPKLSFGPALPLGVSSHAEFLDIALTEHIPEKTLKEQLNTQLPSELSIVNLKNIETNRSGISTSITGIRYRYTFPLSRGAIPHKVPVVPDGVTLVQGPLADGACFVVSFVFAGKALLGNPLKFAQFLRELLSLDAPLEVAKTEVLFAGHSGGF